MEDKGVPSSWVQPLLELAGRESTWNPSDQNDHSTAYGLFQFLNGTWKGDKTSDPYKQAMEAIDYVKDRYKTPENALSFWDENKWY